MKSGTPYRQLALRAGLLLSVLGLCPAALAQVQLPPHYDSIYIPAGAVAVYSTHVAESLVLESIVIEAGGELRLTGHQPFEASVKTEVRIDGLLDASGASGTDIDQLPALCLPALGGSVVLGSGRGGSPAFSTCSQAQASGAPGEGPAGLLPQALGGGPGESATSNSSAPTALRAGSGAGGRFAADLTIVGSPTSADNLGLVALPGAPGHAAATGALSGLSGPMGGVPDTGPFLDGDPNNDFFGVAWDPASGRYIRGELDAPIAGFGGGGAGDGYTSNGYPPPASAVPQATRGAGGGSGGGLVLIRTREFSVGPVGRVVLNGGRGGFGQPSGVSDPAAGASGGGGSGGMLLVQATRFDLSEATPDALSARGGRGGGLLSDHPDDHAGGSGGPGLIQLHTWDPSGIALPEGVNLDDLSTPNAKVLLPLALPPLP